MTKLTYWNFIANQGDPLCLQKLDNFSPNNPDFLGKLTLLFSQNYFFQKFFNLKNRWKEFCKEFYEIIFCIPNAPIIQPIDFVNPTLCIGKHIHGYRLLTRWPDWPLPDSLTRTHRLPIRWPELPRFNYFIISDWNNTLQNNFHFRLVFLNFFMLYIT